MEKQLRDEMFEKLKLAFAQFEYQVKKENMTEFTKEENDILGKIQFGILKIFNKIL